MADEKMRKIRFWIGVNRENQAVTAHNKKVLREKIEATGKESFKGTKIRQFEVEYSDHSDLALKLMGATPDSLIITGKGKVLSEYDA